MKIISVEGLRPGMKVGRDLFGPNGTILLRKGVVLSEAIIQSIVRLKYASVYISDELDNDQAVHDAEVISEEKRHATIHIIKDFCSQSLTGAKFAQNTGLDVSSVVRAAKDIVEQVMSNPNAVISLVDLKNYDDYTFQHSVSVCLLTVLIGRRMRLAVSNLEDLALGALLHDVGKMALPLPVLNKAGRLTTDEFELIKTHPRAGFDMLAGNRYMSAHSKAVVLQHQEKFNGSGYPKGLAGTEIHLNGRIGAIADVFDACTSDRPYRKRMMPHRALQIIKESSGTHFDPDVVDVFLRIVTPYPLGTRLLLSTGQTVAVINVNAACMDRPMVQVIAADGSAGDVFDLLSAPQIQIEQVLED